MLGRIIFLTLLFYLIYLLVRFFQSLGEASHQKKRRPDSLPRKAMVKDEMCDTYLPEDEAIKESIDGRVYYFCSEDCRQRFLSLRGKGG